MNEIKNIVIVCEFAQISGGAQNIAIGSALELARRGYNVVFFTAIGALCDELRESAVTVRHLHIENITEDKNRWAAVRHGLWNGRAADALQDVLEGLDRRETVVHVHSWSNAFSSAVVRRSTDLGFRTVATLHDYLVVCPNGGFYDYRHRHICTREPMSPGCVLCNCDRRSFPQKIYRVCRQLIQNRSVRDNPKLSFITISELNDRMIRHRVRSKRVYRVDNFVRVNPVDNPERAKRKGFLFVGRVAQEKGVELFCEAFAALKRRRPEVTGRVLGDGPLLGDLRARYPEMDFSGWVSRDAVDAAMAEARCLVFPSVLYECSPLTVLEALSSALPCIAADCTAATERISDGENGYLFRAGDAGSLAEKMEEALLDARYEAVVANIKRTFDPLRYTCQAHTDRVLDVYRQIEGG